MQDARRAKLYDVTDDAPGPPPDHGLRRMLMWTAIALACAVLFAVVAVALTIRIFGS
jgi:hypothetical protein